MITPTTAPTPGLIPYRLDRPTLGSFLVITLVLCASWMAREIDNAALNEQKSAIATYIEDTGQRIQLEQSTAATAQGRRVLLHPWPICLGSQWLGGMDKPAV